MSSLAIIKVKKEGESLCWGGFSEPNASSFSVDLINDQELLTVSLELKEATELEL